jgi:hypothetical protein
MTEHQKKLWKCYNKFMQACGFVSGFAQGYEVTKNVPSEKWSFFLTELVSLLEDPMQDLKQILEELENE